MESKTKSERWHSGNDILWLSFVDLSQAAFPIDGEQRGCCVCGVCVWCVYVVCVPIYTWCVCGMYVLYVSMNVLCVWWYVYNMCVVCMVSMYSVFVVFGMYVCVVCVGWYIMWRV